ncbi:hypothetical protein H6M51_14830 [Rhizobium sp. AQ_MP]|uniref:hypothetical protein n=1 Tax=Rhizobium sp. AQ_MP TaxID=2761536 RepID=UPI0016396E00|nr:hypothetical protein [Rhizobium sp. AQ_MP]MBC2774136.1 hypothetical protein [Rhizobium sp. AQ_MP]
MLRLGLILSFALLASCSDTDPMAGDVTDKVHPESYGVQLGEYKLMDQDKKLHWINEYVADYKQADEAETPKEIKRIQQTTSCAIVAPPKSALVRAVVTHGGEGASNLFMMSKSDVSHMAQKLIAVVKGNNSPQIMLSKTEGRLYRIDVVVTEETAPVHLVLASRSSVLWNIQKAPRTNIVGVTVISGTMHAAIANLDKRIPVIALVGDAAKKCGAIPAVKPVMEFPGLRMQLHAANKDEKLQQRNAEFSRFDRFFRNAFGVTSAMVAVGQDEIVHAAIGPIPSTPESRLPYKGIDGATILATEAGLIFYGSESDYTLARRQAAIKQASIVSGVDYNAVLSELGY